jgi:DNA-binding NtrC family response regulator
MKRILVVDDEKTIRHLLDDLLSNDYQVTLAATGMEARQCLDTDSFDLLITDLVMPELNGVDLVMGLQKTQPALKIIAMSGGGGINGRFDYLPVAQLVGASKILRKPFALVDVSEAVKELIGK